ncbi:MAG: T9SS type A sorting domain-containing protein [Sphingobacteriaceae bacterium]
MRFLKKIIVAILLILNINSFAQNLVPNGDFETYSSCPLGWGFMNYATGWVQPTMGTCDFLDTCATTSNIDVPINYFGIQTPYNGGGYAGLYAYYSWPTTYREYIQIKLTSQLIVNKKYYVSFRVSLADSSRYATDDLGAYISQYSITSTYDTAFSNYIPQISNPQNQFLTNKTTWKRIFGSYKALGGEEYITIGNFKDDNNTDTVSVLFPAPRLTDTTSYYYIDRVCISLDSAFCFGPNDEVGITELTQWKSSIYYANEKIIINLEGDYTIEIFDMYGIKRKEEVLEGKQLLDVSTIEKGCYIVILHQNGSVLRKKLYISN